MGILLKLKNKVTRFLFGYVVVESVETRETTDSDVFVDITCTPTHQYYLSEDGVNWYVSHNCDDLISEQNADSKAENEKVYNWWPRGFESRILPGGKIVLINTRWTTFDPAGWLLERSKADPSLDQWKVITVPAILNTEASKMLGLPEGGSYWPEFYTTESLIKKMKGMPKAHWLATYQQNPISLDGNIIHTENFQDWGQGSANVTHVIASLDTAFSTKESADYSVIQIWGVFPEKRVTSDGKEVMVGCAVLLSQKRGRWEYPDLVAHCEETLEVYSPDVWIIEKKASGQSLIQDLRRRGFFVVDYVPDKDKVSRAYASTPFIDDERVFIPRDYAWAEDFINECFVGDTKVYTANGLKAIKDIKVGDEVMTHKGRFRKVNEVFSRKTTKLVELKAAGLNSVKSTDEHPFFTLQGGFKKVNGSGKEILKGSSWKCAEDLKPKSKNSKGVVIPSSCDYLTIPKLESSLKILDLLALCPNTASLVEGDNLRIKTKKNALITLPRYLELTKEAGWVLGLFAAEGCVTGLKTTWTCDKHETKRVEDFCTKVWGLSGKATLRKTPSGYKPHNGQEIYSYSSGSKILAEFFSLFGKGAKNKIIPDWVFQSNSEFKQGFIDGLIQGDGHTHKEKYVTIGITSESLLWGLKILLQDLGIYSSVRKVREAFDNYNEVYQLSYTKEAKTKFLKEFDNYTGYYVENVTTTYTDPTTVYNLEVDEDNTYLTEGGLVHNCKAFDGKPNKKDDQVDAMCQAILWLRDSHYLNYESEQSLEELEDDRLARLSGKKFYW